MLVIGYPNFMSMGLGLHTAAVAHIADLQGRALGNFSLQPVVPICGVCVD